MSDWADEIAENMRGEDDELLPFVCLAPVAKALRKARADGMREAASIADWHESDMGHGVPTVITNQIVARIAEIEKGNA